MKWYFASRMRHKETINKIIDFLKNNNQEISYEWSKFESLKPYNQNKEKASNIANKISDSINQTDIFVLISDKEGTDMFIELGIAIGKWLNDNKTKIYVVGEFNNRSLMHFHPAITRVKTIKNILDIELPKISYDEEFKKIAKLEIK